mgnify:FL=1
MAKEKEMNPSSQMVFDMAKIFLDIQTSSFASGMKHAKEDAERERKLQAFADKCERDLGEKPIKMYKVTIIWGTDREEETSYAFETQEELDAFLLGIAECDGWWEYEIKEKANE